LERPFLVKANYHKIKNILAMLHPPHLTLLCVISPILEMASDDLGRAKYRA